MTNTEQNIACAELDGWTEVQFLDEGIMTFSGFSGCVGIPPGAESARPISDYRSDLDACARLVAKLTDEQIEIYHSNLFIACDDWPNAIDATAPQRIEAILRATGKWRDES